VEYYGLIYVVGKNEDNTGVGIKEGENIGAYLYGFVVICVDLTLIKAEYV
jgi:hypothetical protein